MDIRKQLVLSFSLALLAATAEAVPPPIAAFARQEQVRAPRVSPDGRYVAFISSAEGQRVAAVVDLQNPGVATSVLSAKRGENIDLSWCGWGNNTRLVCGFTGTEMVSNMVFRTTQLAAADADGSNVKILMKNARFQTSQSTDDVLDWTPDDPKTVLIQSTEKYMGTGTVMTSTDVTPAIFKLDIYSGVASKVMNARPNMWNFRTDGNGEVRLASGFNGTRLLYSGRLVGAENWHSLAKMEAFEQSSQFIPLHVIAGTNKAYATSNALGRNGLWEIDLADKLPPKLVFEHPQVDIEGFEYERATGKLLGYWYHTDRPFFQYEDDRLGSIMRGINKARPDTFNHAVSYTEDFKTLVIRATSDVNAGTYYVFDAATRKLTELGRAYPELDSKQLGRMRSIEYKAQDGTTIPGYLTTPLNVRAEKLPLIVMPHGGPIDRDTWEFNFLQQFLVSRGYAVLQMNFRGSSGYGSEWFQAAHQDWGGLTYSDISDAARWAVAQGIADPARTCIVGWSFGGYAALLGAVRNSDLFKCSVSIAGLSDLADLYDLQAKFLNEKIARRQLGEDRGKLKDDSPARHAQNVKMPVLLIHGTRDAQAPFDQSEKMARALKSEKKPYKFVEIKDADRSLWRPAERETMLREVEEFLKTHLGPGATPQS